MPSSAVVPGGFIRPEIPTIVQNGPPERAGCTRSTMTADDPVSLCENAENFHIRLRYRRCRSTSHIVGRVLSLRLGMTHRLLGHALALAPFGSGDRERAR